MSGISQGIIAVDWGTSNCRASLMGSDGEIQETRRSTLGAGQLESSAFEPALNDLLSGWPDLPVWICGMAGSRQGWKEADYLPCPANLADLGGKATFVSMRGKNVVQIVPGLSYRSDDGIADIMRGEETQIAGFLHQNPDFDGIIVTPGTHSKWIAANSRQISRFQTYLTGELYALLSKNSILRHSVSAHASEIAPDDPDFLEGLALGLDDNRSILAEFFQIRAHDILDGIEPDQATAKLSGMLIGAEFFAAKRNGWCDSGADACVIGGSGLASLYGAAFEQSGRQCVIETGIEASTRGLWHLANLSA